MASDTLIREQGKKAAKDVRRWPIWMQKTGGLISKEEAVKLESACDNLDINAALRKIGENASKMPDTNQEVKEMLVLILRTQGEDPAQFTKN